MICLAPRLPWAPVRPQICCDTCPTLHMLLAAISAVACRPLAFEAVCAAVSTVSSLLVPPAQ